MFHFKRNMKKAFTLVELAIVIGVIAILIAVLVPTFISIINKAKKSNDQTLVYNANNTLSVEGTLNGETYDNVTEAISALVENGYSVDDLVASADDCVIAYDISTNSVILLENYTSTTTNTEDICIINPADSVVAEAYSYDITNFCYYSTESGNTDYDIDSITETIENYDSASKEITVWLYTESSGTVTLTSESATVKHYGSAATVVVNNVADNSYHVYGSVGEFDLYKGHAEFCDGSVTGTFKILGDETSFTFTKGAQIGDIIATSYTPTAVVYKASDDSTEETTLTDKSPDAQEIAAALYPYGLNYRADTSKAEIKFETAGGTLETTSYTLNDNNSWQFTIPAPTYSGYQFDGWYLTEDSGTTEAETETPTFNGGETATLKSDLTLYAHWTQIFTVTYNYNYEGAAAAVTNTVIAGNTAAKVTDPERTGYTFGGWYTDSACTDDNEFDFNTTLTGNVELYAKWTIITYTVYFYNYYGGENHSLTTLYIDYNNTVDASEISSYLTNDNPTPYYPDGKEDGSIQFEGWYYTSNETFAKTNNFVFGKTLITEDTYVYANWVASVNTVTFNLNGGSLTLNEQAYTEYSSSVNYGGTISNPVTDGNLAKAEGYSTYEFGGWYTDSACTAEYDFDTAVTADITLYAKWECTVEVINGVIYTRVKVDEIPNSYAAAATPEGSSTTTITFAGTVSGETTTGYYWVITGYTTVKMTNEWLVLENTVYGSPVLEIAAGALAGASIANVIVPENIVMAGSRSFLDNKGITSIVFLADTVYFSCDSGESYYNSNTDNYYNSVESGGENSKNFPFYGCGTDDKNTSTNLTVYYKNAYDSVNKKSSSVLDGGVFVVGRHETWYGSFDYYTRTNNVSDSAKENGTLKSEDYVTICWLYINTNQSVYSTFKCGGYNRGDFDSASALTDVLENYAETYGLAYCSNASDGYAFIATDLETANKKNADDDSETGVSLQTYIAEQFEIAISQFTAEYGEYIHGYSVTAAYSSIYSAGCDLKISTTTGATTYYLVDIDSYISLTDDNGAASTIEWTADNSKTATASGDITIYYSAELSDGTAVTSYINVTGNDVEYFEYNTFCYSTYYTSAGSTTAYGLFAAGDITVKGDSQYNYEIAQFNGNEYSADSGASITISKITDVTVEWAETEDNYIYIVSDVEFTYTDYTGGAADNVTTITAGGAADNVTTITAGGSALRESRVSNIVKKESTLPTTSEYIKAAEDGYYFLGWAYMYNSETLTFTSIAADSETFDNGATTYYAIWGYWLFTAEKTTYYLTENTSSGNLVGESGSTTLSISVDSSVTLINWYYYNENTAATTEALVNGTYTYYANAAANKVVYEYVTYTFTKGDSKTYTNTNNKVTKDCIVAVGEGGYYEITAFDFDSVYGKGIYDSDDWLVLKNSINSFPVIAIIDEAFNPGYNDKDKSRDCLYNIIVPENIVYIGTRAFAHHETLANVVFLADRIYLDNGNGNGSNYYPFYNDSSTVAYYKTVSSMGEATMEDSTTGFRYDGSSGHKISTYTDWMYINTNVSTVTIAGSTFDLQSNLIAALEKQGATYCLTSDNYMFIAAGYDTVSSYVSEQITAAIDEFSATYGSYINGHTVTVSEDNTHKENNFVYNLGITADETTSGSAYYLTSITSYIGDNAITDNVAVENDSDGNVVYTYTGTDYTLTLTVSNAEYYESDAAGVTGVYVENGATVSIDASSDKSTHGISSVTYNSATYEYVSGVTYDKEAMTYTTSFAYSSSATEIALVWASKDNTSTITVYSTVAAAYNVTDGASISAETDTKLDMDTAFGYGETDSGKYIVPDLVATESGYYFLGWAVYMSSGAAAASGDLTFTTIYVNDAVFDSSADIKYYAIWGYSSDSTAELADTSTDNYSSYSNYAINGYVLSSSNGTFYRWYTESTFSTEYSGLVDKQFVYFARWQFTLTVNLHSPGGDGYFYYNDNYSGGGIGNDTTYKVNSSTKKEHEITIIIYEGEQVTVYTTNTFLGTTDKAVAVISITTVNNTTTYHAFQRKNSDNKSSTWRVIDTSYAYYSSHWCNNNENDRSYGLTTGKSGDNEWHYVSDEKTSITVTGISNLTVYLHV